MAEMRKAIRIMLSPFVFIITMAVTIAPFPFGLLAIIIMPTDGFIKWLMGKPREIEWDMVFITFTLPYITTRDWIKGNI